MPIIKNKKYLSEGSLKMVYLTLNFVFFRNKKRIEPKLVRGFTLVELLVVISIIGLLSGVVLASLNSARDKARLSATFSTLLQIQKAIQVYAVDHNGNYPLSDMWWYVDYGSGFMGTQYMSYGPYLGNTSDPFFSDFVITLVPNYLGSVPNFNISSFLKSNQPKNWINLYYYVFKDSKEGSRILYGDGWHPSQDGDAVYCGGIKKERYVIVVMSEVSLDLKMPEMSAVFWGEVRNNPDYGTYLYCIGE